MRSSPAPGSSKRDPNLTGSPVLHALGRGRQERDVQRLIERYANTNLDRHATPHSLRHTALTILARSGVDIATVAQNAGHSNVGTTSIYMDDSMVAAAQAIDGSPLSQD